VNINLQLKQKEEEIIFLKQRNEQLEEENRIMLSKVINKVKGINHQDFNKKNSQSQLNEQFDKRSKEEFSKENLNDHSVKSTLLFLAPGGNKIVTKKIIREITDDICANKIIFDRHCFENRFPKETMEQYMYTYLYHKYGLKVHIN